MSNARRHNRSRGLPGTDAHPPSGRVRRFFWRCRRWLGIH